MTFVPTTNDSSAVYYHYATQINALLIFARRHAEKSRDILYKAYFIYRNLVHRKWLSMKSTPLKRDSA